MPSIVGVSFLESKSPFLFIPTSYIFQTILGINYFNSLCHVRYQYKYTSKIVIINVYQNVNGRRLDK